MLVSCERYYLLLFHCIETGNEIDLLKTNPAGRGEFFLRYKTVLTMIFIWERFLFSNMASVGENPLSSFNMTVSIFS